MAIKKTRFLILQDKIEKQLFSVEERKSGDLLIGLSAHRNLRINGFDTEKPRNRKISVHVSASSSPPANTITHEIGFSLRRSHKGYAVVRKVEGEQFIWPIYCQAFGKNEKRFINRYKFDELRRITAYDSAFDTLLLAVFVTDATYSIPESHGLSVTVSKHENFNINVVTTFADIRTIKSTFDIFNYTSSVRDGNFMDNIGGIKSTDTFLLNGLETYL